jgi:hypothetical protein
MPHLTEVSQWLSHTPCGREHLKYCELMTKSDAVFLTSILIRTLSLTYNSILCKSIFVQLINTNKKLILKTVTKVVVYVLWEAAFYYCLTFKSEVTKDQCQLLVCVQS